ncbi:MAG: hypothetical protein JXA71_04410 [Chitinispirillaceae bacterium]|nr:hypothetical protein [Chitinispirillaceae bacterium]
MKNRFSEVVAGAAFLLTVLTADAAEVAGGFMIGEPTGFSLRINKFPVLCFGWSLPHDYVYVNCDYWLIDKPFPNEDRIDWYLGVGGALGAGHEAFLGCRVPIGIKGIIERRFELFGEIAPGVAIAPEVGLFANGGIGFRYIF